MKVYYLLVTAFCIWTKPVVSQFFYSTYTPFASPYPSIFPQPFLPSIVPQIQSLPPPPPPPSITYNLPSTPQNQPSAQAEYRGFGYRTDFKDGASSTVYFVTGPESDNLRNLKNFPNFNIKTEEKPSDGQARTLASNILDNNAIPDIQSHIRNILEPVEFQTLFNNVNSGAFHFYTYPAGTAPLTRQSLEDLDSSNETTTTTTSTTTETTTEAKTEEVEGAESRVLPNTIDNGSAENETSTEAASSASVATTEAASSASVATTETASSASVATTEAASSVSVVTTEALSNSVATTEALSNSVATTAAATETASFTEASTVESIETKETTAATVETTTKA